MTMETNAERDEKTEIMLAETRYRSLEDPLAAIISVLPMTVTGVVGGFALSDTFAAARENRELTAAQENMRLLEIKEQNGDTKDCFKTENGFDCLTVSQLKSQQQQIIHELKTPLREINSDDGTYAVFTGVIAGFFITMAARHYVSDFIDNATDCVTENLAKAERYVVKGTQKLFGKKQLN
jgi:hypothetical protein